jgi:hypothetical protein
VGTDHHVLSHGQLLDWSTDLERSCETVSSDPVWFPVGDAVTVQPNATTPWRIDTAHTVEQRRLPCSVGANQAENFGFVDLNVDVIECQETAEILGEVFPDE